MLLESVIDLYEDIDFFFVLDIFKGKMLLKFRYVFKDSLIGELVKAFSLDKFSRLGFL